MLLMTWGSTVDTDMETDSCMSHDTDETFPTWILDMNRDTYGGTFSHGDIVGGGDGDTLVANVDIDNLTMLPMMLPIIGNIFKLSTIGYGWRRYNLPTWMVNMDGDRDRDTGRRQGRRCYNRNEW